MRAGLVPSDRLRAVAIIVILDIAAPLLAYNLLRSAGLSTVSALLLSGVFPALGVALSALQHRRLDAAGALILAGIVVGTVLGLASHSSRLVLAEGSVPTAVFGLACLGSLRTHHPLMFRVVHEFAGPDTASGQEMTRLWRYDGYRHVFRVITAAWGAAFAVEAALRIVIVYHYSAGTALALSKAMPFVFGGVLSAWTIGYGAYQKRKGTRQAAAAGWDITAGAPATPATGETTAVDAT